MAFMRTAKRRVRLAIAPIIFLAVSGYFGWNATQGDRGLRAYAQLQQEARAYKAELARVEAERDALERRVAGLRPQRLNRDSLDERARAVLNVADPADLVVLYGPGHRLF